MRLAGPCIRFTFSAHSQESIAPLAMLGRGASGVVWQAVHVPSLRVVAVKTIPVFEEGRRHQMVRELKALYNNLVSPGGRSFLW
jgi:mitogen-activated protein kinase kinase 3